MIGTHIRWALSSGDTRIFGELHSTDTLKHNEIVQACMRKAAVLAHEDSRPFDPFNVNLIWILLGADCSQ